VFSFKKATGMTERRHKRNSTLKHQLLLTLLFADDQVVVSNREDNLWKAACKLNPIVTEHG